MSFLNKWFTRKSRNASYIHDNVNALRKLTPSITYDDILLEPQFSDIDSRKDVDISTTVFGKALEIPIISANMDSVTWIKTAKEMHIAGGLGILHRYTSYPAILAAVEELVSEGVIAVPSIGVQAASFDYALAYIDKGASAVCIDIAHGDSLRMLNLVERLAHRDISVIAGNVATYGGFARLANAGASAIKIGVGPGSMCTTRLVTGHGVPQLTALMEAASARSKFKDVSIIADGGVKYSGDIVKALAFGADAVMIGSLFAGSDEAPGLTLNGQKIYRGMASREARSDFDINLASDYTPEGVSTMRRVTGPIALTLEQLVGGIKSGFSYSGANDIAELRDNARFLLVSHSSNIEGTPHGLKG